MDKAGVSGGPIDFVSGPIRGSASVRKKERGRASRRGEALPFGPAVSGGSLRSAAAAAGCPRSRCCYPGRLRRH